MNTAVVNNIGPAAEPGTTPASVTTDLAADGAVGLPVKIGRVCLDHFGAPSNLLKTLSRHLQHHVTR